MSLLIGYGQLSTNYDFFLFDAEGRVWAGSWVSWVDADYLDYRIPATASGPPGRYQADLPSGAEGGLKTVEMRFRGGSLAASYVVWTEEVECGPSCSSSGDGGSDQSLDGIAAEIAATAAGPQSIQVDGQQVVAQPIPDLIKADQYLARKRARQQRGFWGQIARARFISPGAVDETC